MARALIVIGNVWLCLAAATIMFGYGAILYNDGWYRLTAIASPFNVWNWLTVVLILLPGLGLTELGKKLQSRRGSKPRA